MLSLLVGSVSASGSNYPAASGLNMRLLNILLAPVINRNRQALIFDGLLPFIPEIDRTTIRFVFGLVDPDPARQQTGVTDDQGFACIEGWQDVAESA